MVCFLVPWYLCPHAPWFKKKVSKLEVQIQILWRRVTPPLACWSRHSEGNSCHWLNTASCQNLYFSILGNQTCIQGKLNPKGTGHWMEFQVTVRHQISNLSEAPHYNFLPFQKPWNPLEACGGYLWILGQCCIQLSLLWVSEHIITVALFYHPNHPTNFSLIYILIIYNNNIYI